MYLIEADSDGGSENGDFCFILVRADERLMMISFCRK